MAKLPSPRRAALARREAAPKAVQFALAALTLLAAAEGSMRLWIQLHGSPRSEVGGTTWSKVVNVAGA